VTLLQTRYEPLSDADARLDLHDPQPGRVICRVRLPDGTEVEIVVPEPADGTILVGVPLRAAAQYLRVKYWPLLDGLEGGEA